MADTITLHNLAKLITIYIFSKYRVLSYITCYNSSLSIRTKDESYIGLTQENSIEF